VGKRDGACVCSICLIVCCIHICAGDKKEEGSYQRKEEGVVKTERHCIFPISLCVCG